MILCDICEEWKNFSKKKRVYMKIYFSGVKFERIVIDIVGLFLKINNGFVYILVIVDYFIKFIEIFLFWDIEVEIVVNIIFFG